MKFNSLHKHVAFRRAFISLGLVFSSLIYLTTNLAWAEQGTIVEDTSINSKLSIGTGWTITPRHIVTNYHVISDTVNLRVVTPDKTQIPVKVVLEDPINDIVILEVMTSANLPTKPLPLTLNAPRLGARVYTVGYPHPELLGMNPKLTTGYINAMSGLADDKRTYQISVPVQSGNSGGPLLNMNGEVVAIVTSKLNATKMFEWTGDVPQNINYAVKVKYLNMMLGKLPGSQQIRIGGHSKPQSLEVLAGDAVDSIVIVIGDNLVGQNLKQNKDFVLNNPNQTNLSSLASTTTTVLVYSYAEPGIYDQNEDIQGSSTIDNYSKNTADLIQQHLHDIIPGEAEYLKHSGKRSRKVYYRLERPQYRKDMCNQHEADNIIASSSEKTGDTNSTFRYVSFRIVDCKSLRVFSKQYTIERDETNDGFSYETALYISFKDFIFKMPPYIQWSRH